MDDVEFAKPAHIIPRIHTWFLSPFYSLSRDWERRFRRVWPYSFTHHKSERTYELPNDMLVEFKTGENPEALVSAGLDLLPSTEMQAMQGEAWEQVEPTLVSPWRYGLRVGTGIPWPNPKMEQLKALADGGAQDVFYLSRPSSDNPHINQAKLAREVRRTAQFLQGPMYLGLWPQATGTIFRHLKRICSIPDPFETEDGPIYLNRWGRGPIYEGLDPARLHDFMVYVAFEWRDGKLWQLAYDRFNKQDWKDQYDRVQTGTSRYPDRIGFMDASRGSIGDPVLAEFERRGVPFTGIDFAREKDRLVRQAQLFFDNDKVRMFNIESIREEFRRYQGKLGKTGHVSYGAPDGDGNFDDIVSAVLLAIDACVNGLEPPSDALISELHRMVA